MAATGLSVAVDIGGTFTDLVGFDQSNGKVYQAKSLTTPSELSQGVWDCFRKAGIAPSDTETLVHGSTVAINIAIEEKGAKTALVVTRGTRDVYKIGRQNRPEAYNFDFRRPRPLADRSLTFEIEERMSAAGVALTPISHTDLEKAAQAIRDSGVEAVAVCFLHSYANPEHELEAGKFLRQFLPNTFVSLSHEIVREYREYERTSTTVMNAYIGPRTSQYVSRMQERLKTDAFTGRFLVMQSSGGVISPEQAKTLPIAMMESGPVGGVIAASEIGRRLGIKNVIAFDMGGTTAKTSLIQDNVVSVAQGYYIGGYASGHPVMYPVVDIIEVGAGGGSIAWIDEVGALKLGPHSAGSDPGPIAYGRGGTQPTVTDANVVLGRIGAQSFLGGQMPLDEARARKGITESIGAKLGLDVLAAAHGIIKIAVSKMALTVRGVSVQRGFDPRDFVLVGMGGAGPPHALEIARDLGIPKVVIPNLPANFSALGMLLSDIRQDFVRTYYDVLASADWNDIRKVCVDLSGMGRAALAHAGVEEKAQTFELFMDLRYIGQEFHLQIPVSAEEIEQGRGDVIRHRFNETHERRFSHSAPDEGLELVNLRLAARGAKPQIHFPKLKARRDDAKVGTRSIVFDDPTKAVECPVYRRDLLGAGMQLKGPCAIEEFGSTTIAFEGDRITISDTGEIIVEVARP